MLCVELQVQHNMHCQQCHWVFRLQIQHINIIQLILIATLDKEKLAKANGLKKKKPGFTKSDNPKSMAFSCEFSSFDVNKKFWSSKKATVRQEYA